MMMIWIASMTVDAKVTLRVRVTNTTGHLARKIAHGKRQLDRVSRRKSRNERLLIHWLSSAPIRNEWLVKEWICGCWVGIKAGIGILLAKVSKNESLVFRGAHW